MLSLAWIFSTNRRAIRWRTVLWGLSLQLVFAVIVIRFTWGERALATAGDAVTRMLNYAFAGSEMVFGELGKQHSSFGAIFAFQVLPTIIFISALFAVLYHIGVMQVVIRAFAWAMQRTMKISGASVCPMKMLAATLRLSAPETLIVQSMRRAKRRMTSCMSPM